MDMDFSGYAIGVNATVPLIETIFLSFFNEISLQGVQSMRNRLVVTNMVIKTLGGQSFRRKSYKTVPLFEGERSCAIT